MRRVSGQAGKMAVPLLGILSALAVIVAGVSIGLQFQERNKRLAKERELQQVLLEKEEVQARLQDTERAKAKIEGDLARTRKDLEQSTEKLAQAVEAQTTLTKAVEEREAEIGRLNSEMAQARTDTKQATEQLTQLRSEHDGILQQVADLKKAKDDLESKVMELSSSDRPTVELGKVVVNGTDAAASQAPTIEMAKSASDGQVVVVNREYDFIVMNIGRNHGLSIGQEFQVVRNDEVMGRVKVEKVYDELSAAAILQETQPDNIHEGDLVRPL